MPPKPVLQLFAKVPEKGNVKTRLQEQTNKPFAFDVASTCIDILCQKTKQYWQGDVELWFANGKKAEHQIYITQLTQRFPHINIRHQQGQNLGERMLYAMQSAKDNAQQAVILGMDIPHILPNMLAQAYQLASEQQSFIGPCIDGGYYIISCHTLDQQQFDGVNWGSEKAYEQTIKSYRHVGLSFDKILVEFYDIDYIADVNKASALEPLLKELLHNYNF